MLKARDIMNPNPPFCRSETPVGEVVAELARADLPGLLVVDEDRRLQGVITESDLVEQERRLHVPTAIAVFDMVIPLGVERFERELARMQALTAADLMSRRVRTVHPDSTLDEIAEIMSDRRIHFLPVIDGDEVVGVITQHDVIKALARRRR